MSVCGGLSFFKFANNEQEGAREGEEEMKRYKKKTNFRVLRTG